MLDNYGIKLALRENNRNAVRNKQVSVVAVAGLRLLQVLDYYFSYDSALKKGYFA